VQISRFRAGDSVDVMITARLPLRALARHGKSTTADVDVGLFVTGSRGNYLERDSSRSRLSPADDDAIELRSWRTRLSPGTVEYRVEGLEVSSLRGARAAGTLPIVRKRGLATSDLMIADAITQIPRRATARWTDYLITPNTGEIERSKPVTLLWENYGLTSRDGISQYRVHLSIARSGALGQEMLMARVISGVRSVLGRTASGSDSLSFVFARTGPALDAFADHLTLDVSDLPEGRYTLRLMIEDVIAGKSTRGDARELIIRRGRQ
jgi:hypothetical protein